MSLYKCPHCGTICGSKQDKDGSTTYGSCACANKEVLKRIGATALPKIQWLGEGLPTGNVSF